MIKLLFSHSFLLGSFIFLPFLICGPCCPHFVQIENASKKNKVVELEEEIKKLSGQQNLQQRIHHHAKIKVICQHFTLLKVQADVFAS